MNESPSKRADIICNLELETILRKELPNVKRYAILHKNTDNFQMEMWKYLISRG